MIVLASGSPHRRAQLERCAVPHTVVVPALDETPRPHENARELAARLAQQKAHKVFTDLHPQNPNLLAVIGSDQVCTHQQSVLGKPGTVKKAQAQLQRLSGQRVTFYTAVCVCAPATRQPWLHVDTTEVHFRRLSSAEIARYVDLDDPLSCAGSFKIESLGVHLFDAVHTHDPSALQGLPMLALLGQLRRLGFNALDDRNRAE